MTITPADPAPRNTPDVADDGTWHDPPADGGDAAEAAERLE
jgi:hypothetical protein